MPWGPQKLSFAPLRTLYEIRSDPPKREVVTYSKAVQTSEPYPYPRSTSPSGSESEPTDGTGERRQIRKLSRRQRERDEELRQNIRREIEEELKSLKESEGQHSDAQQETPGQNKENFPARALSHEELEAVTSSNDFLDFVERSSKVIERALDDEYDVLADYRQGHLNSLDDEDDEYSGTGGKSRRIKEVMQFYDERWSKKRIISDIDFSPKVCHGKKCYYGDLLRLTTIAAVPRTPAHLTHQESVRASRSSWRGPRLEHAHALTPRIHLPQHI